MTLSKIRGFVTRPVLDAEEAISQTGKKTPANRYRFLRAETISFIYEISD